MRFFFSPHIAVWRMATCHAPKLLSIKQEACCQEVRTGFLCAFLLDNPDFTFVRRDICSGSVVGVLHFLLFVYLCWFSLFGPVCFHSAVVGPTDPFSVWFLFLLLVSLTPTVEAVSDSPHCHLFGRCLLALDDLLWIATIQIFKQNKSFFRFVLDCHIALKNAHNVYISIVW